MEITNVGVIGVGALGQRFSRLLLELPQARLAGVADALPDKAESVGASFGVPAFRSSAELMNGVDVDAVIIATADDQHVEPTITAARAGKPILLEKPLATSVADGQAILRAVAETGVPLMVGQCVRFDSRYAAARTAIRNGRLGTPVHMAARRNSTLASSRHIFDRCSVSMFLGVHDLDYMLWTVGQRVIRVSAVGRREALDGQEVYASILSLLTFENGLIASLETSWAGPTPLWQFVAVGNAGVVSITSPEPGNMIYSPEGVQGFLSLYSAEPVAEGQTLNVYQAELVHFLRCLTEKRPFLVQPREALAAVAVAEAIDRSVVSGQAEVPAEIDE